MELPNDIASCHKIIKAQSSQIEELQSLVKMLMLEISELKSRLDQNSNNSNKPPSSDGLSKPSVKPALPKTKKSRGGQKGHSGKTLEMVSAPDEVEELKPIECSCGHCLSSSELSGLSLQETRQVFDLPKPKLYVKEYQRFGGNCSSCGQWLSSDFPSSVGARVQYGSGVRALSVLLSTNYNLAVGKIKRLFEDLFGYSINESSIVNNNKTCFESLAPSEEAIKASLLLEETVHGDETGLRVAGKLHWLHVCSSEAFTHLFVDPKRGKEAIFSSKSILTQVKGWLVHDCWSSYFKLNDCQHAICGAHILRELQALDEAGVIWAKWFKRYFLTLLALTRENPDNVLTPEQQTKARRLFQNIWKSAHQIEPLPQKRKGQKGRKKATKGRNLLARLNKYQDAVLAFAFFEEVPFTNNLAERDIRPTKTKQKVSGCFRTFEGAEIYARISSFISTARKQHKNVWQELRNIFKGQSFLIPSTPAK